MELAIAGLQAVLGRTIEAAGDAVTATELSSEVCGYVWPCIHAGIPLQLMTLFPWQSRAFPAMGYAWLEGASVHASTQA